MKQYSYIIRSEEELTEIITGLAKKENGLSRTVLFHLFTYSQDAVYIEKMMSVIKQHFPTGLIAGSTTSGEFCNDDNFEHTTNLVVMFFESAEASVYFYSLEQCTEQEAGDDLYRKIRDKQDVRGIEFLFTVRSIMMQKFTVPLDRLSGNVAFFGGGADLYQEGPSTFVFDREHISKKGVAAIVYCGKDLMIGCKVNIGWKSLGKTMTVTEMSDDGMTIRKIDDRPAFAIYEKYLQIENDDNFHEYAQEFPIVIQKQGHNIVRVPLYSDPEGCIKFAGEIQAGDKIRIGYADPEGMIGDIYKTAGRIKELYPDGILLFACSTRKAFLKEYSGEDIKPFAGLAPIGGFYTYGELIRGNGKTDILNCSEICAVFREGSIRKAGTDWERPAYIPLEGHMSHLQRLVRFLEETTQDLEEANAKLNDLAIHDPLTHLYNRIELNNCIILAMGRVQRNNDRLSVIMLDIDDFKKINDTHGHETGDAVLVTVGRLLTENVRGYDIAGRWGGEEFLIVLPGTGIEVAKITAERIRSVIEETEFKGAGRVTASLGVSEAVRDEKLTVLSRRVDEAMYLSKQAGKNCVTVK